MNHASNPHPSKDVLVAFADGRAVEADWKSLETHVSGCSECAETLADLECEAKLAQRIRLAVSRKQTDTVSPHAGVACQDILPFLESSSNSGAMGRLGHYDILEFIGRGGFGIVLKAFDRSLERIVALKILAPQLAASPNACQRFLREARAAAAVCHENVVRIYYVHEQPIPYLVMEYVAGETLQDTLDRTGPLPISDVLQVTRQVAQGLAAAHARNLIHRDIKPANILLESGGSIRVKISDFGLARTAEDASLSRMGDIAGTPQFMSPEQAQGTSLDFRSDLFSVGSVMYVMSSGELPFQALNPFTVMKRVCDHNARPISAIVPEIPSALAEIIGRLHEKQAAKRIQSADELTEMLTSMVETRKISQPALPTIQHFSNDSRQSETSAARPEKTGDSTKRRWPVLVGLLVIACLFLAGTFVISLSEGQYIITTDDPKIAARLAEEGGIAVEDRETKATYLLKRGANKLANGDYNLAVVAPGGLELDTTKFTIKRFGKIVASVTSRAPEHPEVRLDEPASSAITASVPQATVALPADLAGHPLLSPEWKWSKPENLGRSIYPEGPIHEPFVSGDEKTLVFRHLGDGWTANRASRSEPFGKPVKIAVGSTPVFPSFSKDGLTLSFCSVRPEGFGAFDLMEKRRTTTTGPFGATIIMSSPPNSPSSDGQACYSNDGLTIIFCSDRPGGLGSDDFWTATRPTLDAPFDTPVHLGNHLNWGGQDYSPTLAADDRILLFASTRPGPHGGFDIWMSVRPTKSDPFGPPINLGPQINTPQDEGRPSLSSDGQTLYFDSNRPGGHPEVDLWCIRRLPKAQ